MYDPTTAAFIRTTPSVSEIDIERLPELLTECFAQICTARLYMDEGHVSEELLVALAKLRYLAQVLEIHAVLTTDQDELESAAFVSGSAHQLLFHARQLYEEDAGEYARLTADSIPSELSAGLLFLAAGYPADASEAVSAITGLSNENDPRNVVLNAAVSLCRGRLGLVFAEKFITPENIELEEAAELDLWKRLLVAIRILVRRLRVVDGETEDLMEGFRTACEGVRTLAVEEYEFPAEVWEGQNFISMYPGPFHLATLLLLAGRGLDSRALGDCPDPDGIDPDEWRRFLRRKINDRPYLWTNHSEALRSGLLDIGKSAAISFPTGAGKSTLSELKIAATVISGQRVVYLAPTLALVGQVGRNLKRLLAEADVAEEEVDDGLFNMPTDILAKKVTVMVPERCLLFATLQPEAFEDVGLIVFDECHALHHNEGSADRRPVNALLSLLKLMELSPKSDVLVMSAMMANGGEIAGWLENRFQKECLVFNAAWKPTRQARASLVFNGQEIQEVKALFPPAPARIPQKKLAALPHAVVCMQQTWTAEFTGENYKVLQLLSDKVPLKGSRFVSPWGDVYPSLSLETTTCAVALAVSAAARGLKTIVFFHTTASIPKAVKMSLALDEEQTLELKDEEELLLQSIAEELGGAEYAYLPNAIAGGHFGGLIKEERELMEATFQRRGGTKILYSTNTLAQGMNLPADLVVIVRTKSFDQETEKMKNVDVHDLLNAAGRAGRAGLAANGMVIVVPDTIVEFDGQGEVSPGDLGRLKDELLSQDDRCLTIRDSVEQLLDKIDGGSSKALDYLLLRLSPGVSPDSGEANARGFLHKSFAAYRAEMEDRVEQFEELIQKSLLLRNELLGDDDDGFIESICSATGLVSSIVRHIVEKINNLDAEFESFTAFEWGAWILSMIDELPEMRGHMFSSTVVKEPPSVTVLTACLNRWQTGATYRDIEIERGTEGNLGHLEKARKFARDTIREISYMAGLVAQISGFLDHPAKNNIAWSASVAASLIREGFDTRPAWGLFQLKKVHGWTRVKVHENKARLLRRIAAPHEKQESVRQLLRRVSDALELVEE